FDTNFPVQKIMHLNKFNRLALISGIVALKSPEDWLSKAGTVAQSTPDYSLHKEDQKRESDLPG
ncbi:MAG: hypothetical protein JW755_06725, partial [Candidatus Aminicenantes bacterium]|nr:hypothetical protein [Candidatus Aminicenantes bacterium]